LPFLVFTFPSLSQLAIQIEIRNSVVFSTVFLAQLYLRLRQPDLIKKEIRNRPGSVEHLEL
jgi:hypothetical protein